MTALRNLLLTIGDQAETGWVYLPNHRNWSLDSECIVLEGEEVPPELEDEPGAGVPAYAKQNNLLRVLPVTVVQDVIENARMQKHSATIEDFFQAFLFYFQQDAFIRFEND